MHDVRWERWLDEVVNAYFVAVYRPELPPAERLRASAAYHEVLPRLSAGGPAARAYLTSQLSVPDTQRRNAAARVVSDIGSPGEIEALVACFLDPGRQWLAPAHLVRAARRHPLDPDLDGAIADAPIAVGPALVRALCAHPRPRAHVLLERLVVGPHAVLAQAAVEEVARWERPDLLWSILHRVDGTDRPPAALVPAGITAAAHLALDGHARALDWLEERTGDEDPVLAGLAHAALGDLGWPACLIELGDLLLEAEGEALGYALDAASALSAASLIPSLCAVIRRTVDEHGPGLDDNPADQGIRILERMTGRWVPVELCGYDRHGGYDPTTRRRAAFLFEAVANDVDPSTRIRDGEPLGVRQLVDDLLLSHPERVRRATWQLRAATGETHGLDPRDDLVANAEAIRAWRGRLDGLTQGAFWFRRRAVSSPI